MTDDTGRTRPEWVDWLALVAIAAAVVIASTAGLLFWTRPDVVETTAESTTVTSDDGPGTTVEVTTQPAPTAAPVTAPSTPVTTPPLPEQHQRYVDALRAAVPTALSDAEMIRQGFTVCDALTELVDGLMADGAPTLARAAAVSAIRDPVDEASPADRRSIAAFYYFSLQFLCPRNFIYAEEALPNGP